MSAVVKTKVSLPQGDMFFQIILIKEYRGNEYYYCMHFMIKLNNKNMTEHEKNKNKNKLCNNHHGNLRSCFHTVRPRPNIFTIDHVTE